MHRHIPLEAAHRGAVIADLAEARMRRAEDDRRERALQTANRAADALIAAVMSGTDAPLRIESTDGVRRRPVSDFIGDTSSDCRAVLLAACRHALLHDDAAAALLLRQFVDAVAGEFATDYPECYE